MFRWLALLFEVRRPLLRRSTRIMYETVSIVRLTGVRWRRPSPSANTTVEFPGFRSRPRPQHTGRFRCRLADAS